MTLYRRFTAQTRPIFLASAAGVALCSFSAIGVAQQQLPGASQAGFPVQGQEPGYLPVMRNQSARPLAPNPPVTLTSGEQAASQQAPRSYAEAQANGTYHNDSGHPRNDLGIIDRLSRVFRQGSKTAPVDPGMTYPKASQYQAPPQAPGVSISALQNSGSKIPSIPSIPPVMPGQTPAPVQSQPALFQAPVSANPIADLVPPSPGGTPAMVSQVQHPVSVPPAQPQLPHIPELKELMENGTPSVAAVPAPPESSADQLPRLEFNAPIPAPAKAIAPGEPGETKTAAVTPAPAAPAKDDPFANLFPADAAPETAASSASTTAQVPAAKQPYTGLSLDAESTPEMAPAQAPAASPAPPQAPAAVVARNDLPELPAIPPLADTPALAAPAPATPKSDLDLPVQSDLPKLSSTAPASQPQMEIRPASTARKPSVNEEQKSKFERIAARSNLSGLKGFCPVVLRDERDLVDSRPEFSAIFNGHNYEFSSREAMEKFIAEPAKYAPAAGCSDVIHLALTGEKLEGSLDHAVWYKGRLYLFADVETMETFVAAPSSHASND